MRKLLIILFLLISTLAGAQVTYYIDPTGSDVSGKGTVLKPWASLKHATDTCVDATDTIHINAGTYIETSQSSLAVGVSIVGEGATSIIHSHITASTLVLTSAGFNTAGNQTIRKVAFDGDNYTGEYAIHINRRGNVKIHDCTFIHFAGPAIAMHGESAVIAEFSQDNEIYSNTVTDCTGYSTGPIPGFQVWGQHGTLVHDNTLTQTGRPLGNNGSGMSFNATEGIKVYDNTITTDPNMGDDLANPYTFAIEIWDGQGGMEIYDNDCYNGAIDIGGYFERKGSYAYSVSVHDNFIGRTALFALSRVGLYIEATVDLGDVLIYNNHFKYVQRGIHFATTAGITYQNVSIYYNKFEYIGVDKDGYNGWGIYCPKTNAFTATNWKIDNNVFIYETTRPGDIGMGAILIPNCTGSTVTYWYIRNNIIIGWDYSPIYAGATGTADYLWIQNNCSYSNGNSNDPMLLITPTHYTTSNNIEVDPEFTGVGNYTLQATSDCIDAGLGVGLTLDYAGNIVGEDPDIGAYEFGGSPPTPPPNLPAITTDFTYRWSSGVKCGGSSIDDGGGVITAKGICYSTSANPTTAGSKISGGTGTAEFFVRITDLAKSTTYHIRAYCTNAEGTAYGADYEFTTPAKSYVHGSSGKIVKGSSGKIVID